MPTPNKNSDDLSLSIVVVSYNTGDLTLACLRSVYEETSRHAFEVVVIDNASSDGSAARIAQEFPMARLIASDENHGFAQGNNIAVKKARGEWVLLLNPDTVVKRAAIDRLLSFALEHPEAAIFGGRTLYGDGELNPTSCWARPTLWSCFCAATGLTALFRDSKLFDPESMGDWRRDTVREVDIVTGCFFLLRKSDWDNLGGFDRRFFMYGEEADLCLRAAKKGLKCIICPHAEIIHYGGASEKVRADKMVRLFRARSQLYVTHWKPFQARLGILSLDCWVLVRLAAFSIIRIASGSHAEGLATWRKIWSQRMQWHIGRHEMPVIEADR